MAAPAEKKGRIRNFHSRDDKSIVIIYQQSKINQLHIDLERPYDESEFAVRRPRRRAIAATPRGPSSGPRNPGIT
ncbi:hypothetical protein ABE485_00635 [Achromobacter spanius]|uniref:hypothetical protein n=1 Tax=Achromobacter spanius TaxID=217203 RepID=UPI00320A5D2C